MRPGSDRTFLTSANYYNPITGVTILSRSQPPPHTQGRGRNVGDHLRNLPHIPWKHTKESAINTQRPKECNLQTIPGPRQARRAFPPPPPPPCAQDVGRGWKDRCSLHRPQLTHTHTPAGGGGVGRAGDGYSLQPLVVTDQGPVYCLKMKRQGMLHLSRKVEKPDEDLSPILHPSSGFRRRLVFFFMLLNFKHLINVLNT